MTKVVDIEKYEYSGYGLGFDRKEEFGNEISRNVIIFWVDMSLLYILMVKDLHKD